MQKNLNPCSYYYFTFFLSRKVSVDRTLGRGEAGKRVGKTGKGTPAHDLLVTGVPVSAM